jgi:hypothetical protein
MALVNFVAEVGNFSTEHGYIKAWETFEFKGEKRNRLWTIWTRDIQVQEKDIIEVSGELSTKSATYVPKNATEAKTIVEHSLNNVAILVKGTNSGTNTGTQVRNASDILTQKTDTDPIDMPF